MKDVRLVKNSLLLQPVEKKDSDCFLVQSTFASYVPLNMLRRLIALKMSLNSSSILKLFSRNYLSVTSADEEPLLEKNEDLPIDSEVDALNTRHLNHRAS